VLLAMIPGLVSVRRGLIFVALTNSLVAAMALQVNGADSGVPAFSRVRQSLAIVAASDAKGVSTGTAFCIASDDKRSYFLTNAHVVGADDVVFLRLDIDHQIYKGFVLRTSIAPLDAAVIEIQKGNVPALSLSRTRPQPGASIAIAGYPLIQLQTDLQPSVHAGIVNDVVSGFYIEHDAVTDHGNSGGPLFDPQTGVVYGIVTAFIPSQTARAVQNNLAIVVDQASAFLQNAGVGATFDYPGQVAVAASGPTRTPVDSLASTSPPSPVPAAAAPSSAATPSRSPTKDGLRKNCEDEFTTRAFEHAIDACSAFMFALRPDLQQLRSESASETIPTMHDAFWVTLLLAFAYDGIGDNTNGRSTAMHSIGWALFLYTALQNTDPHLYNAANKKLYNDIRDGVRALEKAYPGSTDAEVKAVENAAK